VVPVIANGVVVDLPTLFHEIDTLQGRGVSCAKLVVSSQAHLIFPWHQALDALYEASRGDARIGTTLKGIGPAYADKARRTGVRAGEVADRGGFRAAVKEHADSHNSEIVALGGEPLDVDDVVERFDALGQRLAPYVADTVTLLHDALDRDDRLLLEGAQATFLDLDHGTYPFVTSSNPTAGGACVGTGIGPRYLTRIVGISKAYATRVGAGPFSTELHDELGDTLVDIGREFGTVTGRRRRTGWLDCVMLRKAVRINSLTELALTKLDVLDTFDEVKVCTEYDTDGRPLYAVLDGWRCDISGVRTRGDLPAAAADFVALVESEVGVPVRIVGTGPSREAVLEWQ
jgi:adenylosuccinate synthase